MKTVKILLRDRRVDINKENEVIKEIVSSDMAQLICVTVKSVCCCVCVLYMSIMKCSG